MRLLALFLSSLVILLKPFAEAGLHCASIPKSQTDTNLQTVMNVSDRDWYEPADFLAEWKGARKFIKKAQLVTAGTRSQQEFQILKAIDFEKGKMDLAAIPASRFDIKRYQTQSFLNHLPLGTGIEFLIHSNPNTGKVIIEYLEHHHFNLNNTSFWESYMTQFVIDVKDGYWRRLQVIEWTPSMTKPIVSNSYVGADGKRSPEGLRFLNAMQRYLETFYPDVGDKDLMHLRDLIEHNERRILSGDGLDEGESIKDVKADLKKLQAEFEDTFAKRLSARVLQMYRLNEQPLLVQLKRELDLARQDYLLATHFRLP